MVNGRVGMVGPRPKGEIGMHALRGGTVAGTHEVHFLDKTKSFVLRIGQIAGRFL